MVVVYIVFYGCLVVIPSEIQSYDFNLIIDKESYALMIK